jgi:hypothetical protein
MGDAGRYRGVGEGATVLLPRKAEGLLWLATVFLIVPTLAIS